jgi:hypothetical protein
LGPLRRCAIASVRKSNYGEEFKCCHSATAKAYVDLLGSTLDPGTAQAYTELLVETIGHLDKQIERAEELLGADRAHHFLRAMEAQLIN